MIFNLLDTIEELSGEWYFLNFNIETEDNIDKFNVPINFRLYAK